MYNLLREAFSFTPEIVLSAFTEHCGEITCYMFVLYKFNIDTQLKQKMLPLLDFKWQTERFWCFIMYFKLIFEFQGEFDSPSLCDEAQK